MIADVAQFHRAAERAAEAVGADRDIYAAIAAFERMAADYWGPETDEIIDAEFAWIDQGPVVDAIVDWQIGLLKTEDLLFVLREARPRDATAVFDEGRIEGWLTQPPPLPWHVEQDWGYEVVAADGTRVTTVRERSVAEQLCARANRRPTGREVYPLLRAVAQFVRGIEDPMTRLYGADRIQLRGYAYAALVAAYERISADVREELERR